MKINVYKAPLIKMNATNFKVENGKLKYDKSTEVIDNSVLLYYNIFGVLVTLENKFPVVTDYEIDDVIQYYYDKGQLTEKKNYCQCFIDTSKLEFVKEEKRKMKFLKR